MINSAYKIAEQSKEQKTSLDLGLRDYPLAIKYMGSKAKILDFIKSGIEKIEYKDLPIVDLFSGACSISGGFGDKFQIISNDIQTYSKAIASCYLKRGKKIGHIDIVDLAVPIVAKKLSDLPSNLDYPSTCSLSKFNNIEERNRALINLDFDWDYHLFTKNYSGTWWSAEQCVWIDTIREVLDKLRAKSEITDDDFMIGITSLMHAMAYSSQGTGHYAQYRDAKTEASMKDINIYRHKEVPLLFKRKLDSLFAWNQKNVLDLGHEIHSLDYKDCLKQIPKSIVYADPPYAFVHYSRFYHAIETIYQYDYPDIQQKSGEIVKGRYREDRHQSPFCISTQVFNAFEDMFDGIKASESHMILSYSNAGMINLEELMSLAQKTLGANYKVCVETMNYNHMTMGRKSDRSRKVQEAIILAKKNQ